jgi:DNA-binding SARP family transcriptional activator
MTGSVRDQLSRRITLLGGFQVTCGPLSTPLPSNVQRVVAFLALAGTPLRRSYVAGTLWPETAEERAAASLRSVLWRIGRAGRGIVDATSSEIMLVEGVRVDLHETIRDVRIYLRGSADRSTLGLSVQSLVNDLLPGWYDEWVVMERERFRELRLHALEALCEQYSAAGRSAEAVEAGVAAVAGEPLRESAHRALICAYLAEGNPGKAWRQYQGFRQLLFDELGAEPTDRMTALMEGFASRDASVTQGT